MPQLQSPDSDPMVVEAFKNRARQFNNRYCRKMVETSRPVKCELQGVSFEAVWTMGLRLVGDVPYEVSMIGPPGTLQVCHGLVDYFVEQVFAGNIAELERRDWIHYYGNDRSECRLAEVTISQFSPFPDPLIDVGTFTPLAIEIRNTPQWEQTDEHKRIKAELDALQDQ